jgi:hypothetical protein
MEEQKNELLELRAQIVAQTKKLAVEGNGSPEARLQILMEVIRSGESSVDMYKSVYEIMQQLPGDDDKMNGMLDLLFEIDKGIAVEDDSNGQQKV